MLADGPWFIGFCFPQKILTKLCKTLKYSFQEQFANVSHHIYDTHLWHAANKKEVLGMKKWVSFCLAIVLLFSAVYVGAQAGMPDSPESMSILLTEGCILLKNSAKLSDLMFLDLDENYVWSGITISPYEWFDLKAAAKSLKIKAEFNGRTLTFDDYLPTGAVIAIESPREKKKYTAALPT